MAAGGTVLQPGDEYRSEAGHVWRVWRALDSDSMGADCYQCKVRCQVGRLRLEDRAQRYATSDEFRAWVLGVFDQLAIDVLNMPGCPDDPTQKALLYIDAVARNIVADIVHDLETSRG